MPAAAENLLDSNQPTCVPKQYWGLFRAAKWGTVSADLRSQLATTDVAGGRRSAASQSASPGCFATSARETVVTASTGGAGSQNDDT